jgi:hypothetical protein
MRYGLDEPKSSKDMFVTQQNLNHSYQALMNEILNLGVAMKHGFDSVKIELRDEIKTMGDDIRGEMKIMGDDIRGEMKTMGDEIRGEMKTMGDDIRGEMKTMGDDIRGEMKIMGDDIRGEVKAMGNGHQNGLMLVRKELYQSKFNFSQEIGELKVQGQKTLAKVEEVHTLAVYALDGYRILCEKTKGQEARLDSLDEFISKF